MASSLEQSIIDLTAQHDLANIEVGLITSAPDRRFFTANVQWEDGGQRHCASGHGDAISKALGAAISTMQVKRGLVALPALADEPLIAEAA